MLLLGLANGKSVLEDTPSRIFPKYVFPSDGKFPPHMSHHSVDKYIGNRYNWLQEGVHDLYN